jgi:AAT family amino acid transporter
MATIDEEPTTAVSGTPSGTERMPAFGRATPLITTIALFAIAVVSWWLIGDPKWSVLGARGQDPESAARNSAIVSCVLFWVIFAHIWTGFNFGTWPFTKLKQPLAGLAHIATNIVLGTLCAMLFTRVVGSWDPTFSTSAAGGAGYTAAAFIVLIGFWAYAFPSASLGNYPFDENGGPLGSVGVWMLGSFLTVIGVVWLVYPNFSPALAADAPVSLPTTAGWVYSSIVVVIVAAQLWDNWPWAGIANRHVRALTALVCSLGGGYLLMLAFESILHVLLPAFVDDAADFPIALETAQYGVFLALCSLIAGLVWPRSEGTDPVRSRVLRTAIVFAVGTLAYVAFMRFFATTVLHFPAVKGNYGGNPLLWADWMILVVLWHSVALGGHFSTRRT